MPSAPSASADGSMDGEVGKASLIGADEPAPYEMVPASSDLSLILSCDHASNRIPHSLAGMGVPTDALDRHIAWDPGAREVTERIAERTGAFALLCAYSRLVIDCNRHPDDPTLIVDLADDQEVPANSNLSAADRRARISEIHTPYHEALQLEITRRIDRGELPTLISIHSFTPVLQGFRRPWHAGVLWDKDGRVPLPLMAALTDAGFVVGDNEPYSGRAHWDYTIDYHAEAANIPHAVIEIRNDLIRQPEEQQRWGDLLAELLTEIIRSFPSESSTVDLRDEGQA